MGGKEKESRKKGGHEGKEVECMKKEKNDGRKRKGVRRETGMAGNGE